MSRSGEAPIALSEWIARWGATPLDGAAPELIDAACGALQTAVALPVRDRRAAHALLAADALLTAAVERLADDRDPGEALQAMIERVAAEPAGEGV